MSAEEEEAQCEQPKTTDPGRNLTGLKESDPSVTPSKAKPQGHDLSRRSCSCRSSSGRTRTITEDVAASDAGMQGKINHPSGVNWYCNYRAIEKGKKSGIKNSDQQL